MGPGAGSDWRSDLGRDLGPPRRGIGAGRYAPSPSGPLHLGNLRTALLAWLAAKASGRLIWLRLEDLDQRSREEHANGQVRDLAALGLDFDGPVVRQSERGDLYQAALAELTAAGLTYPCFCTRREILEAPRAPHRPPGAYPGTCRRLSAAQVSKRALIRPPALRLRVDSGPVTVVDTLNGPYTAQVDDFVLCRGDGTVAYNLAVVVDDLAQGVDQVVRGDDLLSSAPRQAYLAAILRWLAVVAGSVSGTEVDHFDHATVADWPAEWLHVPLVLNQSGQRLAKRDGAVTLTELAPRSPGEVLTALAASCGLAEPGQPVSVTDLISRFSASSIPRQPWVIDPAAWSPDAELGLR